VLRRFVDGYRARAITFDSSDCDAANIASSLSAVCSCKPGSKWEYRPSVISTLECPSISMISRTVLGHFPGGLAPGLLLGDAYSRGQSNIPWLLSLVLRRQAYPGGPWLHASIRPPLTLSQHLDQHCPEREVRARP